ncbi:hypothetical protein [Mucilaginibacter sp.]|uniref:hypothetical protein n=1 Tax=Mucilaginibacter sp. TaxID=1882438 RepID=UPI0035BBB214
MQSNKAKNFVFMTSIFMTSIAILAYSTKIVPYPQPNLNINLKVKSINVDTKAKFYKILPSRSKYSSISIQSDDLQLGFSMSNEKSICFTNIRMRKSFLKMSARTAILTDR